MRFPNAEGHSSACIAMGFCADAWGRSRIPARWRTWSRVPRSTRRCTIRGFRRLSAEEVAGLGNRNLRLDRAGTHSARSDCRGPAWLLVVRGSCKRALASAGRHGTEMVWPATARGNLRKSRFGARCLARSRDASIRFHRGSFFGEGAGNNFRIVRWRVSSQLWRSAFSTHRLSLCCTASIAAVNANQKGSDSRCESDPFVSLRIAEETLAAVIPLPRNRRRKFPSRGPSASQWRN